MLKKLFKNKFSDPKKLGLWGEKTSEKFLKKNGYKTLTKNFSCRTGEIDLIMVAPDSSIVFVEVKTRSDQKFAPIESAVTAAKKIKMLKTAKYFLAANNIDNRPLRFDIITIEKSDTGREKINHYKNVFT